MYTLEPLPESHTESSEAPTTPGTAHGECGPRLIVQRVGGYSSSTATGHWRWCATCQQWRKAVGIMGAMFCTKCNATWPNWK